MKKSLKLVTVAVLVTIGTLSFKPAAAAPSAVEQALQAADILPKKYAFRVSQRGAEALVQTYARPRAPETDVKIDAVLIARIVTEKLPDAAKVKVQFFNYNASSCQQVIVTVGDIKAFGTGTIAKDKLLQSLDVLRIDTATKKSAGGSARADGSGSSTGGSVASRSTTPGVFRDGRLNFTYPLAWTFVPPKDGNSLGEIIIPGTNQWALLNIRKQESPSPEAQAVYDEDYSHRNNNPIVRKGSYRVGQQGLTGYQLLTSGLENNQRDKQRFSNHIYFGDTGEIYSLTLQYAPADQYSLSPEFNRIVNSVMLTRK